MRRSRLVWLVSVLAMMLAASSLVLVLGSSGGKVTRANFDLIQKGMTVDEVERLLGTDNLLLRGTDASGSIGNTSISCVELYRDTRRFSLLLSDQIDVYYDNSGNLQSADLRVHDKRFSSPTWPEQWQHVCARVKGWLGL